MRASAKALRITAGALPLLPLYYRRDERSGLVVVSSELALLERVFSPELLIRRVASLVVGIADPWPGETIFTGVRRLRACETITFGSGAPIATTQTPRSGATYERGTPTELASKLRDEVSGAIARATVDADRVTVLAGGGLDSSGIYAIALRDLGPSRVEALAEIWRAPGDDRPYLEALERHLRARTVRLSARQAAPWFSASLCADAQPQLWSGAAHDMMLWATADERGADVVLSGHGGDIVLGGGRPSFTSLRAAFAFRGPWSMSRRARLWSWIAAPALQPHLPRRALVAYRLNRLRARWMRRPLVELIEAALHEVVVVDAPRAPDDWMRHFCEDRVLAELSMSWGAMTSVTHVAPVDVFRDVELVRFISRIDPVMRSDGNTHRGLYRRALGSLVPEVVRNRQDKASMEPGVAEAALAAGALEHLAALATFRALADLGFVEPRHLRATLDAWFVAMRRGEREQRVPADESWRAVWQLLSVEEFLRLVGR